MLYVLSGLIGFCVGLIVIVIVSCIFYYLDKRNARRIKMLEKEIACQSGIFNENSEE